MTSLSKVDLPEPNSRNAHELAQGNSLTEVSQVVPGGFLMRKYFETFGFVISFKSPLFRLGLLFNHFPVRERVDLSIRATVPSKMISRHGLLRSVQVL